MTTHLPLLERGCGHCTACCDALQVKELGKGDYERCKHLRPSGPMRGCKIYKDRPEVCGIYECLWRSGAIEAAEFRPDKSGFILSLADMSIKNTETGIEEMEPFIMVHELKPGASRSAMAMVVLEHFATEFLIVEITREGLRRIRNGPPEKVQRMVDIAKDLQAKGTPGYLFEDNRP